MTESRWRRSIAAGQEAESGAVDYYRFTSDLKRHLDTEQRLELIGILWDIRLCRRRTQRDGGPRYLADRRSLGSFPPAERIQKRQEAAARVTDTVVVQDDAD